MRNLRLLLVLAVVYVDMLGVGLAFPVLPRLLQQFLHGDTSRTAYVYGLLASAYALMQFFFAPLFGALSDRFGRRPLILASLGGSAVSYLAMAMAPNLAVLAAARLLAGVMGGSFTAAGAYLADITPPEKRSQSFGLIGAALGLGLITGPAVGGMLGSVDLHLPFLAAGLLCLGNLAFGYFALPESLAPQNCRAFRLADANPVGALRLIARYPGIVALMVVFVLAAFANRAAEMIWVFYTGYRFHWGPAEIGISMAFIGVIFVAGQGGFTRILLPRIGERGSILTGLFFSAAVCVLYGAVGKGWMLFCVMPLAAVAWPIAQPAIQGLMSRAVAADEQGLLQGAMASITSLTSIAAPPLWTGIFGYSVSPASPIHLPGAAFYIAAAVFMLALALALRWELQAPPQPVVA